jgi:taurine transport system permease protein
MPKQHRRPLVSLAAVAAVLLLWFVAGELQLANPLFLPPPGEVLLTGRDLIVEGYRGVSLFGHTFVSVGRALLAFLIAALTGIPIGLMMGMSPTFNAALDPFVQFLRPLPKLALIPLVIVWFGIGEFSKFLLIYLSTFLTIVVASAAAVMSVPEGRIRAALSLGVNRWRLFRYVILPSALPELFTGVRVGIGIGWTTLIAAEMIASSSGLGWMVMNASSYLRTDVVMLGILILGITGYLLDLALVAAQTYWVHWMGKG